MHSQQKIHDQTQLQKQTAQWQSQGFKVVFTNGVFDLLHVGHVDYLEKAAALGDRLVVALNDDASVRRLNKGAERPLNHQQARARVLAALECVAAVTLFGEDTPQQLIELILPDVLVKGGDYSLDNIVGAETVKHHGGSVQTIPFVEGFSTTSLVERIRQSR